MYTNINMHRVTKIEVFTPVQVEDLSWRERDVYIWQGDRLAMVFQTDAGLWDKFSIEDFNEIDRVVEKGPGSRHDRLSKPRGGSPVEVMALTTKITLKRDQADSGLTKWVTLEEHSAVTNEKVSEITMFGTTQDIEVIWCYEVEEVQS